MLSSYLKTAARSLRRNTLFSTLNIVGLAISMSVGLLLIAFLLDLRTYDRFHQHGDRIYRVTNVLTANREQASHYTTTSLRAGALIREQVRGIEAVAMLRNEFSQDATVGATTLPIEGYWAEPSVFRVFSFPMREGNPETALKAPYSIVLTETSARKLFGNQPALGKAIQFDTLRYQVTGVMQDVPFFSHLHFEALVSLSTAEQLNRHDASFGKWTTMWANYGYVRLAETADVASVQAQLDALAKAENRTETNATIQLALQPLHSIVVGETLTRLRC
jgi:putative ABC transport system permease protein